MSGCRLRNRSQAIPSPAGPAPATCPPEAGPARVAGLRCPACGRAMVVSAGLLVRTCACRPGSAFLAENHQALCAAPARTARTCKDGQDLQGRPGPAPTSTHLHHRWHPIADIGLRMLQPRELFRAQGLSLPKTAQVRLCGNSVCPPIAAALVRANAAQAVREVA